MTVATLRSRALHGIDAIEVCVEVHLANGLPQFNLVGLPEAEVREARDRVRAALVNSRFEFPSRRITVNLAPADLPKASGRFDLPIALGILAASGQIDSRQLAACEFAGELSLTGALRPIHGALPMALASAADNRELMLPTANGTEAARAAGARIRAADSLLDVCAHLCGNTPLPLAQPAPLDDQPALPDLADVEGQPGARRALEIAAAGGHSMLMIGPPGTGKSMLAQRLPGILPPMTETEACESASVLSLAGQFRPDGWGLRPFRAPHHTASAVALVGGGSTPRPGEISLAHHGVLFLDELPEFDRKVLEVLREPLEAGRIHIARAARQAVFPARFQLIAAMNPCPCGHAGEARCHCTPDQVLRYRSRLSGPLLDRIDLHVDVPALPSEILGKPKGGEASATVRHRVGTARERQLARQGTPNAALDKAGVDRYCPMGEEGQALLQRAIHQLGLSARAYHRILRLARTIADLGGEEAIAAAHLAEALHLRRGDPSRKPA